MKQRFGLLLIARDAALATFNRMISVPRGAVRYMIATAHRWLPASVRSALATMSTPLLRTVGRVAAAARAVGAPVLAPSLLGTPPVRRILGGVLSLLGRWPGRALCGAARLVDAGLRRCGNLGGTVADRLSAMTGTALGHIARVQHSTPMAIAASVTRPTATVLGALARALTLHRLLRRWIPSAWLRNVVELTVVPMIFDGRLLEMIRQGAKALSSWLSDVVAERTAAPVVVIGTVIATTPAAVVRDDDSTTWIPVVDAADDEDAPMPQNRAERRQQQRDARPRKPRSPRE